MQLEEYSQLALKHFSFERPGAFYGAAAGRSLGAGLIYSGIIFPLYNLDTGAFDTVEGTVYILTHECDVDQENVRQFNDLVVVCPLISLENFVSVYESALGEERLKTFLTAAAKNDVVRVFFLPPAPEIMHIGDLAHGAMLYLNQLCSTHVSIFRRDGATPLCALSDHGLDRLDWKIRNLLFRPKYEELPRLT
jgi:hypothetical protein